MFSREILSADASVVDLHKLGPHFYELGLHVLPFTSPSDSAALAKLLTQVATPAQSFYFCNLFPLSWHI